MTINFIILGMVAAVSVIVGVLGPTSRVDGKQYHLAIGIGVAIVTLGIGFFCLLPISGTDDYGIDYYYDSNIATFATWMIFSVGLTVANGARAFKL